MMNRWSKSSIIIAACLIAAGVFCCHESSQSPLFGIAGVGSQQQKAGTTRNSLQQRKSGVDQPRKTQERDFKYSTIGKVPDDPYHVPVDDETRAQIAEKWGKWRFWDGEEDDRPTGDYAAEYPNRDISGDDLPDTAWQADAVYVNHILNDADKLIARAKEAIYTEYGYGGPQTPEGMVDRYKMFKWEILDIKNNEEPSEKYHKKRGSMGNGGWTSKRSRDGLVRRLLHAIMTNDEFVIVLGGHSAAAGHGNHFTQSYMMQMHKILAPIFARLGVKLVTRNMSQGGLGTLHNSLASGSLYGQDIDILLWDSGMTENDPRHYEVFARQGILSGSKVPLLWGGFKEVLYMLHNEADVDVGQFGKGTDGLKEANTVEEVEATPFAAKYLKCGDAVKDYCKEQPAYCAKCWVERDDVPASSFPHLKEKPGGQVSWHPGWREHQLQGRVLAYSVLEALHTAVDIFSECTMGGPPLDDELWHVTDYYENIRNKVKNLPPSIGQCSLLKEVFPERICQVPMMGATQHTPRANPEQTSLAGLVRQTADGYKPHNFEKPVYDGPDVHNTCFDIPDGAVDVWSVVSGRRQLSQSSASEIGVFAAPERQAFSQPNFRHLAGSDEIVPGKGWQVLGEPAGKCDGEYDSYCGRQASSECPMLGHHDSRGYIAGNEYSGWLVLDLPNLKEGIIMIRLFTWISENSSPITEGWTSVNNQGRHLKSDYSPQNNRQLDMQAWPASTKFEFAINGQKTTWSMEEFQKNKKEPQRVFEMFTLLDDPDFTDSPSTVELAIRLRDCGRVCTIGLTHVYWA